MVLNIKARRNAYFKLIIFFFALIVSVITTAQGPTSPALGFNVFVNGSASFFTGETEGPIAVGGDFNILGSYYVSSSNNFVYKLNGINIGLLVAGKVNYSSGNSLQVLNNGYVLIGNQNGAKAWYLDPNNAASPIRITPNNDYNSTPNISLSTTSQALGVSSNQTPVFQTSPINFSSAFYTMESTSTSLSYATDNALIYSSSTQGANPIAHNGIDNNSQIYFKTLNLGTTFLNISGGDLNNITSLTFSGQVPDVNHLVVMNVNATGTFTWNAFTCGGISGANSAYILYNFYNTTILNISGHGAVQGTIFAPYANINKSGNNSNLEGQIIGQSYFQTAGGEIHTYNFTSTVPVPVVVPSVSSSNLLFSNIDVSSLCASWTNGNGTNRLVVASTSPISAFSPNAILTENTAVANSIYGRGTPLGGGYVVYNGTGNRLCMTGLTANTKYYFAVVEYNSNTPNNYNLSSYLIGNTVTLTDTDRDGVADIYDAYPNDSTRAFNNYYPPSGFGTYLFEDNWPTTGDYDFNDLVMGYRYNTVTNAANHVVELKASLVVRASGANFRNGFGIQLDGVSSSAVTNVSGTQTQSAPWLFTNANGTEARQTFANVIVVDNVSRVLPSSNNNPITNTIVGSPYTSPDSINLTISFVHNSLSSSDININPYLIINQTRGRELHLINRQPTGYAASGFFDTNEDNSVPSLGKYYVTKNNLPWALDVPATIPYPIEGVTVTNAYLFLANWAQSGGNQHTDWYLNNTGYRNNVNLYSH